MRETYVKVFKDESKLTEMLSLRRDGWTLMEIGDRFRVHHTSVLYQCDKYGIRPGCTKEISITIIPRPVVQPKPLEDFDGSKINRGKLTYSDYLQDMLEKGEKLYGGIKLGGSVNALHEILNRYRGA